MNSTSLDIRPRPQTRPDVVRAPAHKIGIRALKHDAVVLTRHKVVQPRRPSSGNDVDLILESLTEPVEREIILIITEWVLDLTTNRRDAEDDVRANNGAGDGDPLERVPELEREHEYVDPRDLGDGDTVRNRERGVEHAFGPGKDFV